MCCTTVRPTPDRCWLPCCTMRPYLLAAATIWRASNMLCAQGFSTYTSLPAWQARMVCRLWLWFGVAMDGVDGFVLEQFAKVRVGCRPLTGALLDGGQLPVE